MNKSIRQTFFVYMTAILLSSIMVLGLLQIYVVNSYFYTQKEATLSKLVVMVQEQARRDKDFEIDKKTDLVSYIVRIYDVAILITDTDGNILIGSGHQQDLTGRIDTEYIDQLLTFGEYKGNDRLGGLYSEKHFTIARPLVNADGELIGTVFASSDNRDQKIFLSNLMTGFVVSAIMVILLASSITLFFSRIITTPIHQMDKAAQQFAEGDFNARVPIVGDNELTQLAITFNEMAASFETTDESRRNFMGNIAHELRTPMTSIKGFIDGVLDGTIPPEEHKKYLRVVSEEVGRLARLTQNMLDVSKLEVGEYTVDNVSFNIWTSITSVFVGAEQRISDHKIDVQGFDDSGNISVLADKDFVHQILYNLLDNAIKFTPEGGIICVTVSTIKGMVMVNLFNTGPGIPTDTLPHIFDRFYKGDKSRGLNKKGSGLGLHLCKVLIGLMGGRIWADNEPGGTHFAFTLPPGGANGRRSFSRQMNAVKNNAVKIEDDDIQ